MFFEVSDRFLFVCCDCFGYAADGGECLYERYFGKRCGEVDLHLAVGQCLGQLQLCEDVVEELFCQLHQVMIVVVSPVELDGSKLGVMCRIHPFVTEVTVDLEDRFHPADSQTLEVELGCDTQVAVDTECIVVCDERFGVGTAGDRVHHRCLDFEEAMVFEEAADE